MSLGESDSGSPLERLARAHATEALPLPAEFPFARKPGFFMRFSASRLALCSRTFRIAGMSDSVPIPDDPQARETLIETLGATVEDLKAKVDKLEQEKEAQKLEIDYLLKLAFQKRSERYIEDPDQLKLDLGDGDEVHDAAEGLHDAKSDLAEADEEIVQAYHRKKQQSKKPRNEKFPEHLPRYEVTVEASDEITHCAEHGERKLIDYDSVEKLEFIRPRLKVRVTRYPKYVCEGASECGVGSPPRADGLVEGDRYDTSVAAEIIVGKQGYHLPIYRQQDWFAGSGWTPSRSTLLNIQASAALLIAPLITYFRECLMSDPVIGTDDTRTTLLLPRDIPPIDKNNPRSQRIHDVFSAAREAGKPSVSANMWVYRGSTVPLNLFDFTVSRHRDGPDEFLVESGYRGTMLGDCYSGYEGIPLRSDGLVRRAACNAHARRKILEAHSNHPLVASVLLGMYQELYDIEDRAKTLDGEARQELRESEAAAVWARMREYLDSSAVSRVLPKEKMGGAVSYLNNHWQELQVYLDDPHVPIDNNDAEQLMKQVALGRKNWMFVGSVAAGDRAAELMTLVSSALRSDLDVWAYVKDVLDELLAGSTNYESLRPDVWAKSHPEHIRQYRQEERRDRAERKQFRRAKRRQAKRRRPSRR